MSESNEEKELTEAEEAFKSIDVEKLTEWLRERQKSLPATEEETTEATDEVDFLMHDSSTFPQEPIAPSTLALKVSEKLKEFGNTVPNKTPVMVEELCRSFNECIRLNTNEEDAQTLILSPKTGSAKSVSSKMYVSLLEEQASVIVVYTIEDAIQTCRDINHWSGDDDYARCFYSISEENKEDPTRVKKGELSKYRCIVISHALFKMANTKEDVAYLSLYKGRKREFILVDERVDLYKTVSFPLANLDYLLNLFNSIKQSTRLDHVTQEIEFIEGLKKSFTTLQELIEITLDFPKDKVTKQHEPKKFIPMTGELYEQNGFKSFDFSNFFKLLDTKTINLHRIVDPMYLAGSDLNGVMVVRLKQILNDLSTILKYKFYYFFHSSTFQSPVIMVTKNILSSFGSQVVLDATATVNQLYYDKVHNNPENVKMIETTNPRRYNNCTIYQCRGIPQGKGSIYKNLPTKELKNTIEIYTNIANSLIEGTTSKLLIVAHKDFKEMLEKKISNKAVKFTYWGNHRGKNNWNDCDKVLVIGWNHVPTEVHYENYLNAVNGLDYLSNDQYLETKKFYEITQIADDLVQAVNRGAIRNTISEDGDCTVNEVYVFYPNTIFGSEVLAQFRNEFDGVNAKPWKPDRIEELQQLTKAYANIEVLVEYIERKVNELGEIKQSTVQSYFNDENNTERLHLAVDRIPKSNINRYIGHSEFEILLSDKGIQRVPMNMKSYKFTRVTI